MSQRPAVIPITFLNLQLPLDVRAKLDLHLFSELEGRVPKGAYQRFFLERLREFFEGRRLDLAPYVNCQPGTLVVNGPASAVNALEKVLAA